MQELTDDRLLTIVLYAGFGAVYGLSTYFTKVRSGETSFEPRKFGSTVAIGAVAGGIIAVQGGEPTDEELAAAMAIAVPIVDTLYNRLAGESLGGSRPSDRAR